MAYNGDERNPNHWWKIEEVSPTAVYYVGPWEYIRNRRSSRVLQHSHQQQPLTNSVNFGSPVATTSTNTGQSNSIKADKLIPADATQQWRRVAVSEGCTCLQIRVSGYLLTTVSTLQLVAPQSSSLLAIGRATSGTESYNNAATSLAATVAVEEAQTRDNKIFTLQSRLGEAFLENTCGAEVRGSWGAVEASTCCQWAAIRADDLADVAKATVDDVAGSLLMLLPFPKRSTPEHFKAPWESKPTLLDSQAPKYSVSELALGKSTPLPPVLPLSPPTSLPDDSTPATPTKAGKFEPSSSPESGSPPPPPLMPELLPNSTLKAFEGESERERYSITTLPVRLPSSYLGNRVTGMALATHASGSVEAREFEGGSLQQQWRVVSVGRVASAPAVSYIFLQNRASGFVLSHSWWGSRVAASDCHAYSEDELQYHHHWTITPARTTGGKAHWEQEEVEICDKWCKAVQGGGEGSASLALAVDRLWSYVFNRDSGKALAVCEESVDAVDYERRIGAYDNDFGSEYHKWQLRDIEGGVYVVLKNKKTGMVLDHYYWERLEAVEGDEKNKAQHWGVVPARQMAREGMGRKPSPEIESVVEDLFSRWERDSVPKGELKGVYLVAGGKPRHGIRVVKSGSNRSRQIHLLQVTIQGLAYATVAVPTGVEVGRGRIWAAMRRSVEGGGEVVVVDSLDLMRVPEVEGPLVNLAVFLGVAANQVCM
ncbi:unnamed protein product [Closterium sp. Yama58-4]|nr:unnamed protein product [Closterium sp. Yama58-4]